MSAFCVLLSELPNQAVYWIALLICQAVGNRYAAFLWLCVAVWYIVNLKIKIIICDILMIYNSLF